MFSATRIGHAAMTTTRAIVPHLCRGVLRGRPGLVALAMGAFGTAALAGASMGQLSDTFTNWIDHSTIAYRSTRPTDSVAQLNRKIQDGSVQLKFDGPSGYLRSVLEALDVPVESQVAVFLKDSLQQARISVNNPRTLFFNDSVSVGWVRGGFIEVASQDPQQGVIFYALDPSATGPPQFSRRDDCLGCHYSNATVGVPGMLVRSAGRSEVDHSSPLENRWGGWYVTGQHGSIRHLGNVDVARLSETPAPANTLNLPSFEEKFDTTGYLSTHSDIVALMVFGHQMHMMNLLSRMGWEARVGEYQKRNGTVLPAGPWRPLGELVPVGDGARELVDYLLFVNEAPFSDTIRGSSGFAEKFSAQGPYDHKGRSLRQLDLQNRLMRYPCSYMIYAPVFDALPDSAKSAIYQRLWQILSGAEKDATYAGLSLADRRAIVEILRDTKEDLPEYFREVTQ